MTTLRLQEEFDGRRSLEIDSVISFGECTIALEFRMKSGDCPQRLTYSATREDLEKIRDQINNALSYAPSFDDC